MTVTLTLMIMMMVMMIRPRSPSSEQTKTQLIYTHTDYASSRGLLSQSTLYSAHRGRVRQLFLFLYSWQKSFARHLRTNNHIWFDVKSPLDETNTDLLSEIKAFALPASVDHFLEFLILCDSGRECKSPALLRACHCWGGKPPSMNWCQWTLVEESDGEDFMMKKINEEDK